MTAEEVWKDIPRLPEYQASSLGRLMRKPHQVAMPKGGFKVCGGVPHIGCWDPVTERFVFQYKGKTHRVHVLVCEAHNGEKPFPEAVVMHLDENPAHNWATNLSWGTQKQNLNFPGFKAKRSKLSLEMGEKRRLAA